MKTAVNNYQHLYGAIIGDIVGSTYEFSRQKDYDFYLFPFGCDITDDTILTVATAFAILDTGSRCTENDFADAYYHFARKYPTPKGGYGASFSQWVASKSFRPYFSMGNGCAMRVSPCAYASGNLDICMELATQSATATHNHWQSVRAVQALTFAIYYLNRETSVVTIIKELDSNYGFSRVKFYVDHPDLFDAYRNDYEYTELVFPTVEGALICALTATSFEDAIRRAVSLGGDADTLAAIAGSVAEARFQIPADMIQTANRHIPMQMKKVIENFNFKII